MGKDRFGYLRGDGGGSPGAFSENTPESLVDPMARWLPTAENLADTSDNIETPEKPQKKKEKPGRHHWHMPRRR